LLPIQAGIPVFPEQRMPGPGDSFKESLGPDSVNKRVHRYPVYRQVKQGKLEAV
jgi:hypothetical protein